MRQYVVVALTRVTDGGTSPLSHVSVENRKRGLAVGIGVSEGDGVIEAVGVWVGVSLAVGVGMGVGTGHEKASQSFQSVTMPV